MGIFRNSTIEQFEREVDQLSTRKKLLMKQQEPVLHSGLAGARVGTAVASPLR
jgi:hypothetical protein